MSEHKSEYITWPEHVRWSDTPINVVDYGVDEFSVKWRLKEDGGVEILEVTTLSSS